jgi:hypothetical protein
VAYDNKLQLLTHSFSQDGLCLFFQQYIYKKKRSGEDERWLTTTSCSSTHTALVRLALFCLSLRLAETSFSSPNLETLNTKP